ncbi:MAG: tetratricopeptide repeat protein [Planctomycetota bacterium]|nr:tetratricopeptide repeat protein [Planctomycetota bacterium]
MVVVVLHVFLLCGCASSPRTASPATITLDQLSPPIEKPVNPPDAESLPQQVRSTVVEAEKLFALKSYAGAIERLERAAGFAPNNRRIRRALGLAYAHLSNSGKARDNLRRALELAPDDLESQVLLGRLAAAQRQRQQAILAFRTALKCTGATDDQPLTGESLLFLGRLLRKEGHWTAALECYTKLSENIDNHPRSFASSSILRELVLRPEWLLAARGKLLISLRRPNEAIQLLRRAYSRNRAGTKAAKLLMEALLAAKEFDRAERLLVELASQPAQRGQVGNLAEALCKASGETTRPSRIWQAFQQADFADGAMAVTLAQVAHKLGNEKEAIAILQSARAKMPGNIPAGLFLAELSRRRGKPAQALELLADLLAANHQAARSVRRAVQKIAARPGLPKSPARPEEDFEFRFADKAREDRSPTSCALLYVAGELAAARNRKLLAAELYNRVIDSRGDFLPAYESLMDLHLARRRYDQVDRLLEQIKKIADEKSKYAYFGHYINGKVALARGRVVEALGELNLAFDGNKRHVPTLVLLAEAQARTNRLVQAVQTLQSALKLEPVNPDIHRRLFLLHMSARQFKQAENLVKALLARQPGGILGQLMLVEYCLARPEKYAQGIKLLAELKRKLPDNVDVRLLAVRARWRPGRMLSKEQFDVVVKELVEILHTDSQNVPARRLLANALNRQGQHEEAVRVWETLYEETDYQADIRRLYAAALLRAEKYNAALAVLEEVPEESLEPPARWTMLEVLEKLKRFDDAQKRTEAWLKEEIDEQTRGQLRFKLLWLCEAAEDYEKAQKLIDEWLTLADGPAEAALKIRKLQLYARAKQYDKAIEYAQKWIRQSPDNDAPKRILLALLTEAKLYKKAQPLLDEWIGAKCDESVELLRFQKVYLYGLAGEFDKAEAYVEDWLKSSPLALTPRGTLIAGLTKAQKYDEAMKLLDNWLRQLPAATTSPTQPAKVHPTLRWLRRTAVRVLLIQQKYSLALARTDSYIRLDAEDIDLLLLRNSCLAELGRTDEAMAVLEKAHRLDPDNPHLNNDLGYMYAEKGIRLDQAERMIRKALAARPGMPYFIDSLAWVFYKQGRFGEASRLLEQILQADPTSRFDHPVIFDHAGDVYYRLGWKQKAMKLWIRAIETAKAEKPPTIDARKVLKNTPGKVDAVRAGQEPPLAPLGEGVSEPK